MSLLPLCWAAVSSGCSLAWWRRRLSAKRPSPAASGFGGGSCGRQSLPGDPHGRHFVPLHPLPPDLPHLTAIICYAGEQQLCVQGHQKSPEIKHLQAQAPFDACESPVSQPHGGSQQKRSENHIVGVYLMLICLCCYWDL